MSMLPPGTECFDLQKSTSGHLILPMTHYEELDMTKKTVKGFTDEAPRALHADEVANKVPVAPPPGLSLPPEPSGVAAAASPHLPTTAELIAGLPDARAEALREVLSSHLDADTINRLANAFGGQAAGKTPSSPSETD